MPAPISRTSRPVVRANTTRPSTPRVGPGVAHVASRTVQVPQNTVDTQLAALKLTATAMKDVQPLASMEAALAYKVLYNEERAKKGLLPKYDFVVEGW